MILAILVCVISTLAASMKESIKENRVYETTQAMSKLNYEEDIGKLVLMLDLDNTLIYADTDLKTVLNERYTDIAIGYEKRRIYQRPGLGRFLSEMSHFYDLYIFSAGTKAYVEKVAEIIDPRGNIFKGIFSRDDMRPVTILTRDGYIDQIAKPISDVFIENDIDIDLDKLIFIDDRDDLIENYDDKSYLYKISPFRGESDDNELHFLRKMLKGTFRRVDTGGHVTAVRALREAVESTWDLNELED
jgi:TFIIF-interacting CTD phosphatase-like protein